jgi:hypothetical protein
MDPALLSDLPALPLAQASNPIIRLGVLYMHSKIASKPMGNCLSGIHALELISTLVPHHAMLALYPWYLTSTLDWCHPNFMFHMMIY